MRCLWMLVLVIFSSVACAYELDGSITPLGNGRYAVSVANEDGHHFMGNAVDQGDGTVYVTVSDKNGVTYAGNATAFSDGEYQVEYKDTVTGDTVTGTLSVETP